MSAKVARVLAPPGQPRLHIWRETLTKQMQFEAKCVIRLKQSGESIEGEKLERDIDLSASLATALADKSTTFKNIIPTLKELKRIGLN